MTTIALAATRLAGTKGRGPEAQGQTGRTLWPRNSKAPLVRRGSAKLPVSTLFTKHRQYNIRSLAPSGRAEDDGLELEALSRRLSREPKSRAKPRDLWLTKPLDCLANSVQYPLATSSRRNLPEFNIRLALAIRNPTKVVTPKEECASPLKWGTPRHRPLQLSIIDNP